MNEVQNNRTEQLKKIRDEVRKRIHGASARLIENFSNSVKKRSNE